jgi:oxygen-independent coproporphyrinogen III oxidase
MLGLYVHIPFCVSKCRYCDFYSVAGQNGQMDSYIDSLLKEAVKYAGTDFDTLYIGGGTPSLLGASRLKRLMDGLSDRLSLSKLREASIEVNPESATREFLASAISLGINRISIGVQSLDDAELRTSGRIHTSRQALEAIDKAFDCGFTDVSADIIIGLPGQGTKSLSRTGNELCGKGLTHISAYCLSVEEGTPFSVSPPADLPDDDRQSELFLVINGLLKQNGYSHYEISNYSLPGRQCLHNLNYWRGGEYIGLGPAAATHLNGTRLKNASNLYSYLRDPLSIEVEVDVLDEGGKLAEEAMLRLRLLEEGLNMEELLRNHAGSSGGILRERLDRLSEEHLLVKSGNGYVLAEDRVLTSNQVFINVID